MEMKGGSKMIGRNETEGAIREYLRKVRKSMAALPRWKRNEILREIKDHIYQKIDDAKKEKPSMDDCVLAKSVLAEMGSPEQVAKAYAPETSVHESALLRHIGKITALCGLMMMVSGLIIVMNGGFDTISMPPELEGGMIEVMPGESRTIETQVEFATLVTFSISVKNGTVQYELKDPSGGVVASGTASKDNDFGKSITNPTNGKWSIKITGAIDDPMNVFKAKCEYGILEVPIRTVQNAKLVGHGMTFSIIGFFIIIAGGFAGLINTIKRRR